ncbi:NucA/NucB deoxyribonuclease domain-containing protein [Prescottella subtropica]|uniref:NucA/NucB deoxyribonuclease domain-containing protein n=1 Tax=Prescottella subtropica TaxID=2545757 RepID=UPI0010F7BEAA|nr:hypothetical protein [Prescottella subtropica]
MEQTPVQTAAPDKSAAIASTPATPPPSAAEKVEKPEREPGKTAPTGMALVRAQQHALTVPADQLPELPAGAMSRMQRTALPEGVSQDDAELAERMAMVVADNCQFYGLSPFAVCGAIRDKYNAMGGPASFLGYPSSPEYQNPGNTGARSEFLHGSIYWSAAAGAHPITPLFMTKWSQHGWEAGWMGYPTSDEIPNGDNIGSRQHFETANAAIYWNSARPLEALAVIGGAIRDKWGQTGWETPGSPLGYPISDEIKLPDGVGRMNQFERGGSIYWSPDTGAIPVYGTPDRFSGRIMGKWAAANYEVGPFGYPIEDEQWVGTSSVIQKFQGGTIGWPYDSVGDIADEIGSDWDEYVYDENSCDSCGNDDRMTVTSAAYFNVPQPPTQGPDPLSSENSDPLLAGAAEEIGGQMESCDVMLANPSSWPTDVIFCTPSPEMVQNDSEVNVPQGGEEIPNAVPFSDSGWDSFTQPYCENLPQRQWAGNRSYACMWREDWTFIYNRNDGLPTPGALPVGRLHYVQEHELRTVWKNGNSQWVGKSAIHFFRGGVMGEATTALVSAKFTCDTAPGCTMSGPGIGSSPVATQRDHETTFTISQVNPLTAGAVVTNQLNALFYFTHSKTTPAQWKAPKAIFPDVRCDKNAKDQGCVIPEAEPILDMTARPNAGDHAKHIGDAQRSGLPGAPDEAPLTRANQATAQQNRNNTCNLYKTKRPTGQDCDEYPFATTTQGGSRQNVRTWTDGLVNLPTIKILNPNNIETMPNPGMSMKLISSKANRSGGGILTWFFRKNRVFDGEHFYVKGS